MSIKYDNTSIVGYHDGLIRTTESENPIRIRTPNPDGKSSPLYDVVNDWFYIGNNRYNVHPYCSHTGGYPVRWIEGISELFNVLKES